MCGTNYITAKKECKICPFRTYGTEKYDACREANASIKAENTLSPNAEGQLKWTFPDTSKAKSCLLLNVDKACAKKRKSLKKLGYSEGMIKSCVDTLRERIEDAQRIVEKAGIIKK